MLWELSGSSGEGSRVLTVMSAAAKASIIVRFASTKGRPSARRLTLSLCGRTRAKVTTYVTTK
jgi:hypothetical protein